MVWRAQPHDGVLRDVHRPHRSLCSPGACVLAQEEHVLGTFFCKLLDACLVPCSGCRVQEVEPGISLSSCSQDSKWAAPSAAYSLADTCPRDGFPPWKPWALAARPLKTRCCFRCAMRTASCVRQPVLGPWSRSQQHPGYDSHFRARSGEGEAGCRPGCQGQGSGEPRTFPEEGEEQWQAGSRVVQGSKPPEQVLVFHQTARVAHLPRIQSGRSPCAGHGALSLVIGPPKHGPHASVLCPRSGPGVDFGTSRVQNPWEGLSPLA